MWTALNFGKHRGKTLPQVLFSDPDWFFWAYHKNVFQSHFAAEAKLLYRRATSVRIPSDAEGQPQEVEYIYFPSTGRFTRFELVEPSRPVHQGSSPTNRSQTLSFETPRNAKGYDKLGDRIFIKDFKAYFFGSSDHKMTKERCEAFFDNPQNFV